jgi:hypothetical protein
MHVPRHLIPRRHHIDPDQFAKGLRSITASIFTSPRHDPYAARWLVLSAALPFQEVAMRLATQMRGGFYPAPPQAIAHAATFLRPPTRGSFAILDPCAGKGAAVQELGDLLGCPQAMTFAIELDESRAETLRSNLQEGRVLAPANFFGCRASANSFSLTWINPAFDEGYGGQRVELHFLQRVTDWLITARTSSDRLTFAPSFPATIASQTAEYGMNQVFLDTVGLIAVWDKGDQWHNDAEPVFFSLVKSGRAMLTTTLILYECGNTAARRPYRTTVNDLRTWLAAKSGLSSQRPATRYGRGQTIVRQVLVQPGSSIMCRSR